MMKTMSLALRTTTMTAERNSNCALFDDLRKMGAVASPLLVVDLQMVYIPLPTPKPSKEEDKVSFNESAEKH
jgi:hypothetical protein